MLFALTRSNLLRQLPAQNQIILRLTIIVTGSDSNETYFSRTTIDSVESIFQPLLKRGQSGCRGI